MKKQGKIILIIIFLSALIWGCTKNDGTLESLTLKQTINESAFTLNNAMDAISLTKAYSILTITDGTLTDGTLKKSSSLVDSVYSVYIPLDKIKGIYDYKPVTELNVWGQPLIHFFTKVDDNSQMIVRMPLSKVTNPGTLRKYSPSDTSLTNNFSIAVSNYYNNYNSYWDYDYLLASEISVDSVVAGSLNIKSFVNPRQGIHYASEFAFNESYTAKYQYDSGDTTISSFTIMGDDKVLYEEKLITEMNSTSMFGRERQYILTIGDVQIIRKTGTKVVEVYVNGIFQPNAVVVIVDKEADPEASVCKKRDIQITFEDGTTTTVSALIGTSIGNIKTLFDSLHKVYFAAYVVDWIAYDIYYQRN